MTTPRTHPDPLDPARDADRLGDAWDALVAGRRPPVAGADPELLAVVGQLTAEATRIRPTLTFRNSLRESLMPTTPPAALAAPALRSFPTFGRPVEVTSPRETVASGAMRWFRGTGMRLATITAVIALLLATAGYLGGVRLVGTGAGTTKIPAPMIESPTGAVAVLVESQTPTEAAGVESPTSTVSPNVRTPTVTIVPADDPLPTVTPQRQSPTATATPTPAGDAAGPCADAAPILPCGGGGIVGQGLIAGSLYPDAFTDGVTQVEMSTLSINAGQRASFPTWDAPPAGMGMDMVIEGVYAASFTGPAVVARRGYGETRFDYPVSGDLVELMPGDTVTYALGTRAEVGNPLSTQTLTFKSLDFTSLVIAPGATPNPAAGRVVQGSYDTHVDGRGTLPRPLDAYADREVMIYVTYAQIGSSAPLPEDVARNIILGPVDSGLSTEAPDGFTVWAYQLSG